MCLERKKQLLIRSPGTLGTSRAVADDVLSVVAIRFGRASGCMENDVQETRKELAAKATLWTWKNHEALKDFEHRITREGSCI